jgi:hypothetical protein
MTTNAMRRAPVSLVFRAVIKSVCPGIASARTEMDAGTEGRRDQFRVIVN